MATVLYGRCSHRVGAQAREDIEGRKRILEDAKVERQHNEEYEVGKAPQGQSPSKLASKHLQCWGGKCHHIALQCLCGYRLTWKWGLAHITPKRGLCVLCRSFATRLCNLHRGLQR